MKIIIHFLNSLPKVYYNIINIFYFINNFIETIDGTKTIVYNIAALSGPISIMNNDDNAKLYITNIHKNSKNKKENGKKITFNVPNGLSDNTFEYDLYQYNNNNEYFDYHNVDGVKLIYWDNDLFDNMSEDEIDYYLNNEVLWYSGDPINICYDTKRTSEIVNKMKIKYAAATKTTKLSNKRKFSSSYNDDNNNKK